MKYSKEKFSAIMEELGITFKVDNLKGSDLYLFRLASDRKEYTGGFMIFQEEGACLLYVPQMCVYKEMEQKILLMINNINAEIQYGRLYIDEEHMQLSYRMSTKIDEIEKEDIESYLSELLYVINKVEDYENR